MRKIFPILLLCCATTGLATMAADLETLQEPAVFAAPGSGSRTYRQTARADYALGSFAAEVTVTLKGGGGPGCAFFGLGRGEASPDNYGEPSTRPSLYLRLAPSDFAGGQVMASVNGSESAHASEPVGDGTYRVRFVWDAAARRALFDIGGKTTLAVSAKGTDFGGEGRLFIGGANGVRFENFTVKPLTDAEVKAAGFAETFFNDPTAGTWLSVNRGARFVRSLQAGKRVVIATLGTSLTAGGGGWPNVMMNDWLNKDFPGQVTLHNLGVGASASSHPPGNSGLDRAKQAAALKPDVVFIEFATNDAYLPYKISLADSQKNLNTMIETVLAARPDAEIILQTMNSCKDHASGPHGTNRARLADYAEGYREVARARGLLLVDHYPNWLKIMTDDPERFDRLVPDRIHPQAEGYRQVLLPTLKAALTRPSASGVAQKLRRDESEGPTGAPEGATQTGGHVGLALASSRNLRPSSSEGPTGAGEVAARSLACWYEGSRLAATREFTDGKLKTESSEWSCETKSDASGDLITFRLLSGNARQAGVAVAFDFDNWSTNHYVMIPAAVYNGNRYRTVGRGYAAGLDPSDFYRKDLPLTQSNVPRLADAPGQPSKIEVSACNIATPAACVFERASRRGFILLAEQAGRSAGGDFLRKANGEIMDGAFAVEESADRSRATVVVSAPGVRERKPEFIGFSPSPDRGMDLKAGDSISLRLRVLRFDAPDIPGLLERYMSERKSVTGPNHPRNLVPASQVAAWMTQRIDSRFYSSGNVQFYCPENAPWIAFGWIGGWMDTFPMLVLGDDMHLERVRQTFDYGLKAQEPSGYFHYAIHANGSVTFRDPGPDMNMARTSGDMLYWMIKQFELLKAQGRGGAIKPEWEAAMRKLAEAMVATWKKDGQWGKLINVKTGAVSEYNTTGGAMIVGALAVASDYFRQPEYLQVAKAAADFHYARDFEALGQTSGGCADILQNADSETAAGFMTALMALYEVSGDRAWLAKSRNLANLVATWTVSYDYELPKFTELGALGAKLAGVYWASTQNKHGAPGICTSSGDPLFKIYRATGDRRYAELMRDIVKAHGESIRPGGFTNERLTYCDADSRGSRGGHVTGWNETNGALMAQELPGIYLRTDKDEMYVFDSVVVKDVKREAGRITLTIENPTPHPAEVSVFAESAEQAAQPLGFTAFLKWPKVKVEAGATAQFEVIGKR